MHTGPACAHRAHNARDSAQRPRDGRSAAAAAADSDVHPLARRVLERRAQGPRVNVAARHVAALDSQRPHDQSGGDLSNNGAVDDICRGGQRQHTETPAGEGEGDNEPSRATRNSLSTAVGSASPPPTGSPASAASTAAVSPDSCARRSCAPGRARYSDVIPRTNPKHTNVHAPWYTTARNAPIAPADKHGRQGMEWRRGGGACTHQHKRSQRRLERRDARRAAAAERPRAHQRPLEGSLRGCRRRRPIT